MSIKDFKVLSKLGEGAYSTVYKVRRQLDGDLYALKMVKVTTLTEREQINALNEIRILASLHDPNIVGYRESFIHEQSKSLCIVMEYLNGGDLYQKILEMQSTGQYPPQAWVWNIFIQIVQGLRKLHNHKILHRDLKCANIFLSKSGTAKLGDLNVSKVTRKGLGETQTGTPYYASPEVWKDQVYDYKSDIWSLGCVLYQLITLHPPFRANDMEGLYKKVIKGLYPKIPAYYSRDLAIVIKLLLKLNPADRPSCEQILNLPYVRRRIRKNWFDNIQKQILLKTIKIPKNLKSFSDVMPKSNYSTQRHHSKTNGSSPRLLKIKKNSVGSSLDLYGRKQSEQKDNTKQKIQLPKLKHKNIYFLG